MAGKRRIPVVIVGGGPVGMALALSLGLRGIACVLVEERTRPHRIPKGQNLTQRTLEHFYLWGIAAELRRARLMPRDYPIGEITAYGSLASEYWHAPAGRELVRPYYFQDNERLPQYCMEAVLRAKLETLAGVEMRFGWRAIAIAHDHDGVRVSLSRIEDGHDEVLAADYVVGCDGAQSLVCEAAGIGRSGTDFEQAMVLTVFRSRELHEKLKRFPTRSTYRVMHPDLAGYWQFFGRIDADEGFFFHAPVPAGTRRDNFDFAGLLHRAAGFDFAIAFDHVGFWELRTAVADAYRRDRIFIAGDAAHTHPPYGGFGLNNGLEDAVNLAWKLAARLHGWGGEALLDSYTLERQPVFRDVAEGFITARIADDAAFLARHRPEHDIGDFERAWAARKSDLGMRVTAYAPNYAGSPIVFGPNGGASSARGEHSLAARAGHHLAPHALTAGGDVFERLGPGFTLLAFGASEDAARAAAAARTAGIPLTIVSADDKQAQSDYGYRLVLVRPDQFVAWTGDKLAPEEADTVVRRAAGRV